MVTSLVSWSQRGFVLGFGDFGEAGVLATLVLGAGQSWPKQHGTQHGRCGGEDSADDERDMVAAVDGRHGTVAGSEQASRLRALQGLLHAFS